MNTPRFPEVSCSQCGQSFGPGDHGFSHCSDHGVEQSRTVRRIVGPTILLYADGDSPKWAEAKAAARDVLDTAFRAHMPLTGELEKQRVAPHVLEAIHIEIANALFKAWQN